MIRIQQLTCRPGHTKKELVTAIAGALKVKPEQIRQYDIRKQSIDARKKPDIYYSYVVDVAAEQEEKLVKRLRNPRISLVHEIPYRFPAVCAPDRLNRRKGIEQKDRPVIIGTGPAGLFCGYLLAVHGFQPILLERGRDVDTRVRDVEHYWQTGELDTESNVQFGEGGAGTFSDGKLNTLVKDKDGRNREVLRILVEHGAPESILYESKPHIGTDILTRVVKNMRIAIEAAGGQVWFGCRVTGFLQENGYLSGLEINGRETLACCRAVLAIGHSARDTFRMLYQSGILMEAKSFAVGYRVEHPQTLINRAQYAQEEPQYLPPATYKLTAKTAGGRGVYSFCMCPGGYVVNASSEEGRLAVNGMSYSGRGSRNANSAIIVSVTPKDFTEPAEGHLLKEERIPEALAGVAFQERLEERAFQLGQGRIPVQRLGDFQKNKQSKEKPEDFSEMDGTEIQAGRNGDKDEKDGRKEPCMKGQYCYADVRSILPEELNLAFLEGMEQFGRILPGFDAPDVLVSGVESRTSSPVRILRDDSLQSGTMRGLYPCGEGAGYAGGITSAAMDGMRIAQQLAVELIGREKII